MFDIDKYKEIWQTISRNKLRSFLTGFGVALGILLFVVIYGVGNGLQTGFRDTFGEVAFNSIFFIPVRTTQEYKGFNAGRTWTMDSDDLTSLKNNIPEIEYIATMVSQWNTTISNKDKSGTYFSKGVNIDYSKIDVIPILQGRNFNLLDMQEKRKVCVIGKRVYEELFEKDEDPIGKQITANGIYYNVIGVADATGINLFGAVSQSMFVPLTTMQQITNSGKNIDMITFSVYPNVNIKEVEAKAKNLLRKKHQISPTDDGAILTLSLEEIFTMYNNLFIGIKILVWIVGMGSLFAGAVGISNIMLVSIRERTKEIGIRRALGAKANVILRQIIGESLFLTFLAGYIGFFIGIVTLGLIDKIMSITAENIEFNMQLSFSTAVLALTLLVIAGMAAGIIPARYALKIKAIDALRDE
ncbi:MAG: ABC transporter permease [Bacteroidales bacterium]|jgi:putative ABC transport system permease protein|nr:ABC transporter permease [Bacteroidales bacterium]